MYSEHLVKKALAYPPKKDRVIKNPNPNNPNPVYQTPTLTVKPNPYQQSGGSKNFLKRWLTRGANNFKTNLGNIRNSFFPSRSRINKMSDEYEYSRKYD